MDFWFLFKKSLSLYVHPITIALELVVIGVVLVGYSRRRLKKGKKKPGPRKKKIKRWAGDLGMASIIGGAFFLYLCSIEPVADPLIFTLERKYPPLKLHFKTGMAELNPEFIVVLAGGERNDEKKPALSRLASASLARVNAAVELAAMWPDTRIVFTGNPSETTAMEAVATKLGVEKSRITLESESRDTKDHPMKLKPILGDSEFLLVTSGYHMPRAMSLFRGQELDPIPASCDLWVWPRTIPENPYQPDKFIPRIENLAKTHFVFHEYLGLAWAKLRDQAAAPMAKTEDPGIPEDAIEPPKDGEESPPEEKPDDL